MRSHYESDLQWAISIAEKFHNDRLKLPNYLDLLAVTPIRDWSRLDTLFFGKSISEKEKIKWVLGIMIELEGKRNFIQGALIDVSAIWMIALTVPILQSLDERIEDGSISIDKILQVFKNGSVLDFLFDRLTPMP